MSDFLTSQKQEETDWSWEVFFRDGIVAPWFDDHLIIAHTLKEKSAHPQPGSWSFYLPDFFLDDPYPWWKFQCVRKIRRDQFSFLSGLSNQRGQNKKALQEGDQWKSPLYSEFSSVMKELKKSFAQGSLVKAVPIVLWENQKEMRLEAREHVLAQIVSHQKGKEGPFPYGFWSEKRREGMLGLTPELFLHFNHQTLTTMALAGTRRSGSHCGLLLSDPKERKEHQFVVDALVQQLSDWGDLTMSETFEWDLGRLTHLRTDLYVSTSRGDEGWKNFQFVPCLHPTPALGAWPKTIGWEWLRKNRPQQAKRFGAPFGAKAPEGEFFFIVAIRNIQWHDGRSFMATGCGVIAESDTKKEWAELALKREFILESLGLE